MTIVYLLSKVLGIMSSAVFAEGCILVTYRVPHFSISCQLPVKSVGGIVSITKIISLFYFYWYTLFCQRLVLGIIILLLY